MIIYYLGGALKPRPSSRVLLASTSVNKNRIMLINRYRIFLRVIFLLSTFDFHRKTATFISSLVAAPSPFAPFHGSGWFYFQTLLKENEELRCQLFDASTERDDVSAKVRDKTTDIGGHVRFRHSGCFCTTGSFSI